MLSIALLPTLLTLTGCKKDIPDAETVFDASHMVSQGYWYSRYNFGDFVMRSGAGETYDLPQTWIDEMVAMVSDDLATASPPEKLNMLTRIYTGANPQYALPKDDDGKDWTSEAFSSPSGEVSLESLGWVGMKESMWARQFHVDAHFGTVGAADISAAGQRYFGLVLVVAELLQFIDYYENTELFADDVAGHYVLLAAVSDLAVLATVDTVPHSASNRHNDILEFVSPDAIEPLGFTDAAEFLDTLARDLYATRPEPTTVREHAMAIYGLNFYGAYTGTEAAEVSAAIDAYATALSGFDATTVAEQADSLMGLTRAWRATGTADHETAASTAMDALHADFDTEAGVWTGTDTYTADDLGSIFGALNIADLHLAGSDALSIMVPAFENLVNISGFQITAPGLGSIPEFERLPSPDDPDEMFHRYPTTPEPRSSGAPGENGCAPVYAASVTTDGGGGWTVEDDWFDAAGAFHLANEMIWFHNDEIEGYPALLSE